MKVIEDLQLNGLSIVVDKAGFTYGSDAVLTGNTAGRKKNNSCLPLFGIKKGETAIASIITARPAPASPPSRYSRPPASLWRNPSRSTARAGT